MSYTSMRIEEIRGLPKSKLLSKQQKGELIERFIDTTKKDHANFVRETRRAGPVNLVDAMRNHCY